MNQPPRSHPIIFGAESINAIIAGRKTATRRVVAPRHQDCHWDNPVMVAGHRGVTFQHLQTGESIYASNRAGGPGDQLWVREGWAIKDCGSRVALTAEGWPDGFPVHRLQYPATDFAPHESGYWWNKRSPIFMPRWASRITLEIKSIHVERLQDISEADAIAEGAFDASDDDKQQAARRGIAEGKERVGAIDYYREMWDSLNARRGYPWSSNCWVWAVTFSPVKRGAAEGTRE